ncbi:YceD family protein [Brachybacterium sp. DNPG3]
MSTVSDTPFGTALRFDAVDLVGRTGTHRHVERTIPAPAYDALGPAMQVPEGEELDLDLELESVVEGIYAHGILRAHLEGECSRCLDAVEQDLDVRIGELFMYPEKVKADEREDTAMLDGDDVDLAPIVHDALAVESDERPLCRPDCPGLCPQCGFRMEDDPDHRHDVIDDRFAALQGLFGTEAGTDTSREDTAEERAEGDR